MEVDEQEGHRVQEPVRYVPGLGGSRIISRRYWSECGRNFVTRIARSGAGSSATPAASTVGRPRLSRWSRTRYSRRAAPSGSSFSA